MNPILERIIDAALIALAVWYTHRISARTSGAEAQKAALDHVAGVIRQQAQLLGEYSRIIDSLRDWRDAHLDRVLAAVMEALRAGQAGGAGLTGPAPKPPEPDDENYRHPADI